MKPLENKVALVTGAARGIGRAIAERLAADGARVAVMDLQLDTLADTLAAILAHGKPGLALAGDVSSADDWQCVLPQVCAAFGGLDILVNNAGIAGNIGSLLDYPDDVYERVMAVNARSVFLGTKYAGREMKAKGGCIIHVASVSGLSGSKFILPYTASKHAVIGMTKAAALELAQFGIRVNAVCPAPVATEMVFNLERSSGNPQATRERFFQSIPLGRYGEPAEIAAAVAFLASSESSFMTGHALVVDGGMLAA